VSDTETRLIVGMEIHVQVRTRSKMFCACPVVYDAPPNSAVCPVCLGHPGTLPVMNREAVGQAVRVGLALNCQIAAFTKWDRKSYFYPDLPKNYQISQYDLPIARDGWFEFLSSHPPFAMRESRFTRVRIRRAHLEEDAGRNVHDQPGCSLIDFNRAGTPLIEIVTEPDLASAEDCCTFAVELQRLTRHLGVSDGVMQKGQMRFEPNVNLSIVADGREFRTPISEIKNLNSFKAIRHAVEFEARRQLREWQSDPGYVLGERPNENRGWNDAQGITEYQRPKEAAHDYRYFPDPDLLPVRFESASVDRLRRGLPEAPVRRRARWVESFAISAVHAETICEDRETAELFEQAVGAGGPADVLAKQFVNVWAALANERGVSIAALGVSPSDLAQLAQLVSAGTVSATASTQLAARMIETPGSPARLAAQLGLVQERDTDATQAWVDEAFRVHAQAVADALSNPKKSTQAAGFIRGQVMKLSAGRADPTLAGELIERKLEALRTDVG